MQFGFESLQYVTFTWRDVLGQFYLLESTVFVLGFEKKLPSYQSREKRYQAENGRWYRSYDVKNANTGHRMNRLPYHFSVT